MNHDERMAMGDPASSSAAEFTTLAIPESHVEAVIAFMDQRRAQEEDDVSGYMFNSGMIGGANKTLLHATSDWTGTHCARFNTYGARDHMCGDSDPTST